MAQSSSGLAKTMLLQVDTFGDEFRQFEWDLHVLIEWTLEGGRKSLSDRVDSELAKFEEYRKLPNADQEHLTDEYVDILETHNEQDVFLRNAALVSLTTLLNVAIKRMLREAYFKPRKSSRYPGKHEFARLWSEFKERFGIEFAPEETGFVEPMVMARNQIVHEGGDAALIQPGGTLDTSFADSHPQYVRYAGTISASVEVSQELLEKNMEKSIALVRACAERLKAAALSGVQESDLKNIPLTLGTHALERRSVAKEEGQQSREPGEQQQNTDLE
jgi:hypothetical protein